LSTRHRRTR